MQLRGLVPEQPEELWHSFRLNSYLLYLPEQRLEQEPLLWVSLP